MKEGVEECDILLLLRIQSVFIGALLLLHITWRFTKFTYIRAH